MEDQTIVDVRGISKKVYGEEIIHDVSFSVRRGEIYGLLGPNGSGKTFTIRLMVGLLSLTAGDVLIAGHSIKTDRINALAHIGAIVENPDLYGYMTGMQNLKHFARMYGHTRVDSARMIEIAELVELSDVLDRKVKTYSLGMRQRLGIAQALLHRPSVLMLVCAVAALGTVSCMLDVLLFGTGKVSGLGVWIICKAYAYSLPAIVFAMTVAFFIGTLCKSSAHYNYVCLWRPGSF